MKISRIYVDRFGSPTSWYEQTTFDLCDPDSDQPIDACLNLENAGGKTSLLAYIFSCFEPKQDRWLQHLQSEKHAFRDYFSKDVRPSFLITEWIMPSRVAHGADYRLIIGQAVQMRESADRASESDRRFFSFEASAGLRWEDLPVPGISMAPIGTMPDFLGWVQQIGRQRSQGDIYITDRQNEWVTHLEERRLIDVELLKMQVSFNSREGGSEDGFLSFNSESDLVARLLNLSMNQEQTTALRSMAAQTMDRLKSKPEQESRLGQLKMLEQAMVPFTTHANQLLAGRAAVREVEQSAADTGFAMRQRLADLDSRLITSTYAIAQLETLIISTDSEAKSAWLDHIALIGLQLHRAEAAARVELEVANERIRIADNYLKCLEAVVLGREIEGHQSLVKDLERQRDSLTQELKPLESEVGANGAMLRFMLAQRISNLDDQIADLRAIAKAATFTLQEIADTQEEQSRRVTLLSKRQGEIDGEIKSANRVYQSLIDGQHLLSTDIDVYAAIARLVEARGELEAKLEALKDDRTNFDLRLIDARQRVDEARGRVISSTHAQAGLKQFLVEYDKAVENLQEHPLLTSLVEGRCDPHSASAISHVQKHIQSTRTEITRKDIRLSQLNAEKESIEQTGLAGRDTDVDLVVQTLLNAGIRSARPANTYVAGQCPEPRGARNLVLSDPGRYLGVNVASQEWDAAVQAIRDLRLELAAPVIVAVASLEVRPSELQRYVVPPLNDSAYNVEAARVALKGFESVIAEISAERDIHQRRDEEAQAVFATLSSFQISFSQAKVRQVEIDLAHYKQQEEMANAALEAAAIEAEEFEHWIKDLDLQLGVIRGQTLQYANSVSQLTDYADNWETPLQPKRRELVNILEELSTIDETLALLRLKKASEEFRFRTAQTDEFQIAGEKRELVSEHDAVIRFTEGLDAKAKVQELGLGIAVLRSKYVDSMAPLVAEERDKLGLIAFKLEERRNELQKSEKSYKDRFEALDSNLIDSLKDADVDRETRKYSVLRIEASTALDAAKDRRSQASAELGTHWKQHQRIEPSEEMLALDDDNVARSAARDAQLSKEKYAQVETLKAQIEEARAKSLDENNARHSLNDQLAFLESAFTLGALEPKSVLLPVDVAGLVRDLAAQKNSRIAEAEIIYRRAVNAYQDVLDMVADKDFVEVEPHISVQIRNNDFDRACADNAYLTEIIGDRIASVQDTLNEMNPDFESCVTEIYNQSVSAMALVKFATNVSMPKNAPYIGGKTILKMGENLAGMTPEQRKDNIRHYLNRQIEAGVLPKTGAEIITQCLLSFTARQVFGLHILRMEQNVDFQYQPVNDMKKSGGQGTVIAMFLYMLVSHLRVDTQAQAKRGGGGPLFLDNPFANVQTRSLIEAQRLLAASLGIQLICFTANADVNILEGFRRIIRLRKSGVNSKTKRTHIEMVKATFANEDAEA